MMTNLSASLTFTVPLGPSAHRLAVQFQNQQRNPQKAKQVYLNTLAVFAVRFYLRCMGIKTNWETSQSYNPVMQSLMDVADLDIPNLGKLECRPVFTQAQAVRIPPEVWSDRIGYVAVEFDESLKEATLLGFSETADTGELPLSQLRSLEDLLRHLHALRQPEPSAVVQLSQWFESLFEAGWQSLDALFNPEQQKLAYSFRNAIRDSGDDVQRAKLIDLGLRLGKQSVALLVALAKDTSSLTEAQSQQRVTIVVQVHPTAGEPYLPADLKLRLISESGEPLQDVRSRHQDNFIQLKRFRGVPGERFKIEVVLDDARIVEDFVI